MGSDGKRVTDPTSTAASLRRIAFRNFKAFERFSLGLEHTNVLVGPNNSGKSTIIGAARALASGIRTASAKKPERLIGPESLRVGYAVPRSAIPISLENTHTNLGDPDAHVTFHLRNGNVLHLRFGPDSDCQMFAQIGQTSRQPLDTGAFKREFPLSIGVVPILGPLEDEEQLLEEKTVDQNMSTHRASRSFRSYWYRHMEEFPGFREMIRETWPGMDIRPPQREDILSSRLVMHCIEGDQPRELFWTGFGFQIWCQLLTHISRSSSATLFIVDEPETYLHPDLQRRLTRLLTAGNPQLLMATHSSEIIGEVAPSDIVVIDKHSRAGIRVKNDAGADEALQSIGSIHTMTLTAVARTKRVLFVEGDDAKLLFRIASRLGLRALADGAGLAVHALGGHRPAEAKAMARAMSLALDQEIHFAIVLDRDFRSDQEVESLRQSLSERFDLVHIHQRKEIENYLLDADTISRAVASRAAKIERPVPVETAALIRGALSDVIESLRIQTEAQMVEAASLFTRATASKRTEIHQQVAAKVRDDWQTPSERSRLVGGKAALSLLRERLSNDGVSVPTAAIIAEHLAPSAIPPELQSLLHRLDAFRST
jgi:energy-coupling factor transporter ATP-binding protein EcfA2